MLPGLQRPVIAATDYALENHKGDLLSSANPNMQVLLRFAHPDLQPGMFLLDVSLLLD